MDIFTQKRYLILIIFLLVVLNLATLLMLWLGRPQPNRAAMKPPSPELDRIRLQKLIQEELGFDRAQTEKYFQLRQQHRQQVQELEIEIRQIKKQMFDAVLQENSEASLSDSLLQLSLQKQAQIERLTFRHFLDLKSLCQPEQQKKLKLLMHEIFHRQGRKAPPPPSDSPLRP